MDKTPAELAKEEREKIKVTTTSETVQTENEETENTDTEETVDDNNGEGAENTSETTEAEETVNENNEEIEASEKTQEDLEKQKKEADTKAEKDRIQKRIDREVAKRKALQAEVDELKKKLEAKPDATLTEEEVESRAERKAAEKAAEKEFVNACNRLADAGTKLDEKFTDKIQDMADDIGPIPTVMIGILDDLENGAEVLKHLTEDHELALKMYGHNPAKMGVELAKLSSKLAKPAAKPISKVPNPPNTLGGNSNRAATQLNDKMTDKQWIEARNKQLREKGKLHLL